MEWRVRLTSHICCLQEKTFGSYDGYSGNGGAWELVSTGSATATWSGWSGNPATTQPFEIAVPEGETQAILIQGVSRGLVNYWPSSAGCHGCTFAQNDAIEITNGRPTSSNPFGNGYSSTARLRGGVGYRLIESGCTDPNACNYNETAYCDSGNCVYDECLEECGGTGVAEGACDCEGNNLDECGVCNGQGAIYECGCSGIPIGDCDCEGNQLDGLGVCGGDCPSDYDADGICDDVDDCVGNYDVCGVCNGPGVPAGYCDCSGSVTDVLGVCGGDCYSDIDGDGICDDEDSCLAQIDECGVCGGGGIPQGYCDCDGTTLDAIGVCGGACAADADSDGICDDVDTCIGQVDDCGVCNGPGAIYECGCTDMPEGDCDCYGYQLDACGNCGPDIYIDFTGPFDPDHWSTYTNGGNGYLASHDAAMLHIVGNNGGGSQKHFRSNYEVEEAIDVSVSWSYQSADSPNYDFGYYMVNGSQNNLSTHNGTSGTLSLSLNSGDILSFGVVSTDGCCGAGQLRITNFQATGSQPPPCIEGCTDTAACNYDPEAIGDNGSCLFNDECGVCGGDGIAEGDCDCDGNQLDALGVCGGACAADADADGICDDVDDCVGAYDDCGVCNGPGSVYECGCADIPEGD